MPFCTMSPHSLLVRRMCIFLLWYLCHLNTLHQRPTRDLYKAQLGGTYETGNEEIACCCFFYFFIPCFISTRIYLSARPLTRKIYDWYTLLRKPSLLLRNGDTNHAQIWYLWEIKHLPSQVLCTLGSCALSPIHTYVCNTYVPFGQEVRSLLPRLSPHMHSYVLRDT